MSIIQNKIDALPPLPKSVIALESFRKQKEKDPAELQKIIEEDPLLIAEILKVANSSMFSFRTKVETIARAINLLGVNYILSIALGSAMRSVVKTDLTPYKSNTEEFMLSCNLSSLLIANWVPQAFSKETSNELLLPAFLQQIGKFIISDIARQSNKTEAFQTLVASNQVPIHLIEKKLVGMTTTQVSANIFAHWKLSDDLINSIRYIDDLDHAPAAYLQKNKILNVVKTACSILDPLGDKRIKDALDQAKLLGLETIELKKAMDKIKDTQALNK